MKLYSKNAVKFMLLFSIGVFLTVLCSFMIFGVASKSEKSVLADGSIIGPVGDTSLENFEPINNLTQVEEVYQIDNVNDLRTMAYYVNKGEPNYYKASYQLNAFLDLSIFKFWEPIGTESHPFMGTFNGNGYSIYGLTIIDSEFIDETSTVADGDTADEPEDTYRGLFGYVKYSQTDCGNSPVEIKNLGLKDTLIKTKGTFTGGLIGRAEGDTIKGNGMVKISECYNTGYVEGSDYVGGLIGSMEQCTVLNDSYFAGTVRDLDRYLGNIVNTQYDVVTNIEAGCVGGLAGLAVDNSSDRIIENCYNAGVVGGSTDELAIIRGALVGDRSNLKTIGLKRNFFLDTSLPNAKPVELKEQGGTSTQLGGISKIIKNLYFACDVANDYLPANPTKPWQLSAKVNNGLPFLKNTQQLVRIEFDTRLVKFNKSGEIEDKGRITDDDIVNAIEDSSYCLRVGNKFFARIVGNNNITFKTAITQKSDADYMYKFAEWSLDVFETSFNNVKSNNNALAPTSMHTTAYLDFDKIFVANYVEREYTINLNANDSSRVEENGLQLVSGDTNLDPSATIKFGDLISVSVLPKSGYKIASLTTPSADGNFITNGVIDTAAYIRKLGEVAEADNIKELSVMANLEPETYQIYVETNRNDCKSAAIIRDKNDAILSNRGSISYNQEIRLTIDATCIAQNYKFAGWKYQIIDAGAQLDYNAWIPIQTSGEREDSIGFAIPDATDGQEIHFMADLVKVSYSVAIASSPVGSITLQSLEGNSLAYNEFDFDEPVYVKITANPGYYFNTININGKDYVVGSDSASLNYPGASWDAENRRIVFTGLNENISISANFTEYVYNVNVIVTSENVASFGTDVVSVGDNSASVLNTVNRVKYGKEFKFKVALEQGYNLVSVIANGKELSLVDDAFVTVITQNTQIDVTVSKKTYNVIASFAYNDDYNYSVDDSCIRGTGTYYYGSDFGVNIDLPKMFVITKWTVNNIDYDNVSAFYGLNDIVEDINIVIHLGIKKSTISFGQIGDDDGRDWYTIHRNGVSYNFTPSMTSLEVEYGDKIEFNVDEQYYTPNGRSLMYSFAYWQVDGKAITTDRAFAWTADDKNILVEAVFRPALLTVDTTCYLMRPDATIEQSSDVGTISGLGSIVVNYGEQVSLVANAFNGYKFVEWRDSNNNLLTSNSVYQFKAVQSIRIMAVFVKTQNLSIIVDANEGTVEGAGKMIVGDTVTVKATAKKGYKFVAWCSNGSQISNTAEFDFTMPDNNVTLTAIFEQVYVIDYSSNDSSLGRIIGNSSGTFKENVTLEAVCATNCSFVGWMIDNVMISTSTKLNISLNGDVKVQALFKKNFNWNIVIIILGSAIFAIVMVYGAIAYIKSRESQPITTRALIGGKDDSDIIKRTGKRNILRDEIAPVPTRKQQRVNVQPIPVRKIVVEPTDHKGNKVKANGKAKDKKQTLKTED